MSHKLPPALAAIAERIPTLIFDLSRKCPHHNLAPRNLSSNRSALSISAMGCSKTNLDIFIVVFEKAHLTGD